MEFAQHLAEMERLDQRLAYLAAEINHLDTVYQSIPNLLKSQSLIPVNSLRDIQLAASLMNHFGWTGHVTLIGGGPDPWDMCLTAIGNANLPMLP